jgi:hypothetical protein
LAGAGVTGQTFSGPEDLPATELGGVEPLSRLALALNKRVMPWQRKRHAASRCKKRSSGLAFA